MNKEISSRTCLLLKLAMDKTGKCLRLYNTKEFYLIRIFLNRQYFFFLDENSSNNVDDLMEMPVIIAENSDESQFFHAETNENNNMNDNNDCLLLETVNNVIVENIFYDPENIEQDNHKTDGEVQESNLYKAPEGDNTSNGEAARDEYDCLNCDTPTARKNVLGIDYSEHSSSAEEYDTDETSDSNLKNNSRKIVQLRKKLRNTGQSYVTKKGKTRKARQMGNLSECRLKCKERLPESFRHNIFEMYWKQGNYNYRRNFVISSSVQKLKETARVKTVSADKQRHRQFSYEYYFEIEGKKLKVCKKCFVLTIGETNSFVEECLKKKQKSAVPGIIPSQSKRGSAPSANKHDTETRDLVKKHINSFPRYESHYTRKQTAKQYLPSHLNVSLMHNLYMEDTEYGANKVSRTVYSEIFHQMNLSFKQPKLDTCSKCDQLHLKIRAETDPDVKGILQIELDSHQAQADEAYEKKRVDKEESVKNSQTKKTLVFDLQQCLPTPYLNSSVAFYKRQLWTFNLTVHDTNAKLAHCYMWHESISGRGGNQIASCLYRHLCNLSEDIETVTLYSDTCAGQNRNSHVTSMFMCAMAQDHVNLTCIDHKFLVPGHTHMECDQDHSVIERKKQKTEIKINHPYDWYRLVELCGKQFRVTRMEQEHFLDFASLMKSAFVNRKVNTEGERINWLEIRWCRYQKSTPGQMQYKNTLDDAAEFKTINFLRRAPRGKSSLKISNVPPQCHHSPVPISIEKKKNLLELLPFIDKEFHSFYKDLPADNRPTIDPDLAEENSVQLDAE